METAEILSRRVWPCWDCWWDPSSTWSFGGSRGARALRGRRQPAPTAVTGYVAETTCQSLAGCYSVESAATAVNPSRGDIRWLKLATAVLFGVVTLGVPLVVLPAYLWLTAAGVALSLIDIDHKRLPNVIVYPTAVVVGAWLLSASLAAGDTGTAVRTLIAGVSLFAFYLILALVYPAGMGLGDVKLAFVLGLALGWLSWSAVIVGTFLAFGLGAMVGLAIISEGTGRQANGHPFGPFMLAGTLLAVFVAEPIFGLVPVPAVSACLRARV